jgi:HlyD family secretion protein
VKKHASKRTSRNRWIIFTVIALAIISGGAAYYRYNQSQSASSNAASVETTTIGTGDIILSATGLGTLIPNEEVSFGFKNRGSVSDVLVKLGDTVEAGQVLAHLENSTLTLEYQQAQANLAALSSPSAIAVAEQAVQDAEASLATAKDTLQLLIGPDLLIAEDKAADAQQALQLAKAVAEKDTSAETKQKVTDAEAVLARAETLLAQAQNDYTGKYVLQTFIYPVRNSKGVTISRQLFAPTDVEISVARADYELARANLSDAQNYLGVLQGSKAIDQVPASSVTAITEAQTALAQAKANLDATTLTAPISGTITAIDINAGDDVDTSAVITISNLTQPYTVDAYLDETDWDKAKVGYKTTVTFDLLPNQSYAGKIIRVYPALDDSSGTALVHIRVQLNDHVEVELPASASASVDVTGGEALGAILVPTSALKEVEPGKYIVYLMKNNQPVEQEVEIGLQDILNAEVKSGLQTGDVVLTNATTNQ